MYPRIEPYEVGTLKVSDIHTLHYDISGNKNGTPVVFLHGGPGVGTNSMDRSFFNPEKYKIICFDQRGSGKSTPRGSIEENTTQDLVSDIEKLRELLKVVNWHVFGGSWGSTLSLVYAQTHPERVKSLVMWGIFTLRESELRFTYQDGASHVFPEAWDNFVAPIPEAERDNLIHAYHVQLNSADPQKALRAAKAWSDWEQVAHKFYGDATPFVPAPDDKAANAFAWIENHYFVNKGFLKEGQILEKQAINSIRHIPTIVVQGRYDLVCPPTTAYTLEKVWPEITLHIVPSAAHSSQHPGISKLLVEATDKFADL